MSIPPSDQVAGPTPGGPTDVAPAPPSRWARMLPPTPLARRLSLQSVLFAVGDGTFLTGSAVFFTQVVGLSAAQVGLGLTVAGLVSFVAAVPLGRLADRIGPRRAWTIGSFTGAGLYAVWPLVGGLASFLLMLVVLELTGSFGSAGRGAYSLDVFPREDRVRSLAFMRAALNIGFTLGALVGGVALAFDSLTVVRAVPWVAAVVLLVNAFFIAGLPDAEHDSSPAQPPGRAPGRRPGRKPGVVSPGALRNRGFLALSACDGVLSTNQVLLNVVIPLWLVEQTDAPRVLLAWLFGTNTVLAVLLQVAATRGVDSVRTSLRAARISAVFFVGSCVIVLLTHDTLGWTTIALVWLGHVTVTGAELFQSAGHWGFMSELSDPARRGEYQGAAQLGGTAGSVWAPAAYTYLAVEQGTGGWLVIAAVVVAATLAMGPSARAAERYLAQSHPAVPA